MTAGEAVRRALVVALRASPAMVAVEGLLSEPTAAPPMTALPSATVEDPQVGDWSTKDAIGRELRTAVTLRVAKGQAARLDAMVAAVEAAGAALSGDIGGWRVASAVLLRSRSGDAGTMRTALVEHRVRVLAS